jgi:hypothetical protein
MTLRGPPDPFLAPVVAPRPHSEPIEAPPLRLEEAQIVSPPQVKPSVILGLPPMDCAAHRGELED